MQSGQSEAQPDSYLRCLAMLPISFLSEQGDRLAGLCAQPAVGDGYPALFASSVWAYSLHVYVELVREQLGSEVAEAVCLRQREMFEEAEAGAGRSLESAFLLIDGALHTDRDGLNEPEAAVQVPPVERVALALLLGMSESPDYSASMDERSGRIRTRRAEVEGGLARCLLQAREELLAACSELFACERADR